MAFFKPTESNGVSQLTSVALVAALRQALGEFRVRDDESTRANFSHDLFWQGQPPLCVVVPACVQEVQTAVRLVTRAGHPVVARGGGMSYSAGYVTNLPGAVLFDMRSMNQVLHIDSVNRYVTVQAGCTWQTLHEALEPLGLRTPYWGPLSGRRATVGGTVSQNSIFFGSVRHGSVAESVVSLDVVLACGSLMVCGSAGRANGVPFVRWGGPDMCGLFIGDAGALGFKVAVSLRLIEKPAALGYASFGFPNFDCLLGAQTDLARSGLGAEAFGIDAYKAKNSAQTGKQLAHAGKTALGIIKSGKSLLGGLKEVASLAVAGTQSLEDAPYSLHLTLEGDDEAHVVTQNRQVQILALRNQGYVLPALVPTGLRGLPFPALRSALGAQGQRWLPLHGILPLGRVVQAVADVEAMLNSQSADMQRLGVLYSPLTTNLPNAVLYEPCFYWFDKVTQLHLEATELTNVPTAWLARKDCPQTRAFVELLWRAAADILIGHGAVNFQMGRAYPYFDTVSEAAGGLLRAIKQSLDPNGLMNPGALGLGLPAQPNPVGISRV